MERQQRAEQHPGGKGQQQIGQGARGGHQRHVAPRLSQIVGVHRNRFGAAEGKAQRQGGHDRHDDRKQGIDMRQRIQSQPAQHPGGLIAQA